MTSFIKGERKPIQPSRGLLSIKGDAPHLSIRVNGVVRLDRCEHSNHTLVQTRTTTMRRFGGGGLCASPNELQSDSLKCDLTQIPKMCILS